MNIRKLKRKLTATKKEKQREQSNVPLASTTANNILPIENCGIETSRTQAFTEIACMIREGNLVRAQYLLQTHLLRSPEDPNALNCLGWIASAINLPQAAVSYFQKTIDLAPHWELPKINLNLVKKSGALTNQNKNEKFLLIKAWGFGFWSDVSHVLGQLLLAELTNRTPIIHWGSNSLFTDDATENAFEFYFEKVSNKSIQNIQEISPDYWPPKWNQANLYENDINKWDGEYSRISGIYILGRNEDVVVSDFYTYVHELQPWIPEESKLYGLSVNELYLYIIEKYLRPKKYILDAVDEFYERHLSSDDFIAVHIRGSDKSIELANIDEINNQYKIIIDEALAAHKCNKIFLMTDDSRLLKLFVSYYGEKIIFTDCLRTNNAVGVHHQNSRNARQLAVEVIVDAYLAKKAKAFIGNGCSNPSLIISCLKAWPDKSVYLLGKNMFNDPYG